MSLYEKLQKVTSEEDVKDAYIKALKKKNESGDFPLITFKQFKESNKNLTEKLRSMVYELEFLKT